MPETVTDREMVIALGTWRGWTFGDGDFPTEGETRFRDATFADGMRVCSVSGGVTTIVVWNPLADTREGMADALELEGLVPEEKRGDYVESLAEQIDPMSALAINISLRGADTDEIWQFLRRTPRQISTAVFSVMCQEEK